MVSERLTGLDLAFLCLEHKDAPLHMGAVAIFRPAPVVVAERMVTLLGERARGNDRMCRRVRSCWFPLGGAAWVEDREFRVTDHVRSHALPDGSGPAELADLTAALMGEPLDLRRPPWQLHVVTGLAGGRFAVISKLHHALCDGAEAVGLAAGLLDGASVPARTAAARVERGPSIAGPVDRARRLLSGAEGLADALADATVGAETVLRRVHQSAEIAAAVLGGIRAPQSGSPMLTAPMAAAPRRIGLVSLDVAQLRRVRQRHGGTLNDVVLAVVTGALRRWLDSRDQLVPGMTVRALIPVSQRHRAGADAGGNMLSGYLCELPVAEADPVRRLTAIRESMDRNKAAGPHRGAGAFPLLADHLPAAVHRLAMPFSRCSAALLIDLVVTTVPLPRTVLTLDGAALDEIYPLVPLAAGHGLGIAIARYRETVHIGLHASRDAIPDIEKLSDAFPESVADLHE